MAYSSDEVYQYKNIEEPVAAILTAWESKRHLFLLIIESHSAHYLPVNCNWQPVEVTPGGLIAIVTKFEGWYT
jgi:hypothetical protein